MKYWEIFVLINGLIYVFLIAKQNKWGWVFGVLGCMGQMYVSYNVKLYLDSGLNFFYVILGIVGFITWKGNVSHNVNKNLMAKEWVLIICGGSIMGVVAGYCFQKWGNVSPYLDGATTVFSVIATFLTIKRYRDNWIFWIFIDALLTYLFYNQGLTINSSLYFIYFLIAIYGWIQWKSQ